MLGECMELLVNLPGQTKGNIGEVVEESAGFYTLEMADGVNLLVCSGDVKLIS